MFDSLTVGEWPNLQSIAVRYEAGHPSWDKWLLFFKRRGEQLVQFKLVSVEGRAGAVAEVVQYLGSLEMLDVSEAHRIYHGEVVSLVEGLPSLRSLKVRSGQAYTQDLVERFGDRMEVKELVITH